jgi:hypothetical protein
MSCMTIPKSKPSQTGPKTAQGKARASKNALTHGLTAFVHEVPSELELAQAYTKQLTEHYQPDSPLESLQVSRIARTWAKLERSYEQERAQLALVLYEFDSTPNNTSDSFRGGNELEINFAEKFLNGRSLRLPFSIAEEEVAEVAKEARSLKDQVTCDKDFERLMPQLFYLVNNIDLYSLDGLRPDSDAIDRLRIVAVSMKDVIKHSSPGLANQLKIIRQLERVRKEEKAHPLTRPNQENNKRREHIEQRGIEEPNKIHEEFVEQIKLFVYLSDAIDKARSLLEKVREHRQLKRASITLPPEESDRFARYQANLERRLSSQIGELRVMQADKVRHKLVKSLGQ